MASVLARWWQRHGDVALVVLGALLVSGKGIFAKLLFRDGVAVESILLLRSWVTLPLVWGWALYRTSLRELAGAEPRLIAGAMLAGLASHYAAAWLNFVALTMINASLERVLLFSYPAMVVLARALAARRWPSARLLIAVMLTYLGVACAVGGLDAGLWQANGLGASLVLASAAGFAYYLIANERVATVLGSAPFLLYASTAGAIALTLHAAVMGGTSVASFVALAPRDWALIIGMTVTTSVLPLFLFSASIRRIGAQRASIVSTIGPPATFALAAWILGEAMHPIQMLGTALIIAGIVVLETRAAPGKAQDSPA
ncbi:MAG: DMT family transporter [Proteobacteria bacterium]|nr:DMT family transporter [Pseudomonadota bacterium]